MTHFATSMLTAAGLCLPLNYAVNTAAHALQDSEPDAPLIPREVFFGNPDRSSVTISPDGRHMAYLAPHEDVMNVWVQTVGEDDARPITRSTERPVRIYSWAENNEQIIYAQDRGGDENFNLYAVNIADGDEVELTPFENVQARMVAADRNFPDEILAAINNRVPQLHDVWRINTRTGERELVYENDQGWVGFVPDHDYNIRVALRFNQQGGLDAFSRGVGEQEWQPFASWGMEDTANSGPLGFARDDSTFYLQDSRDRNTSALFAMDMDDSERSLRLIAEHPQADLNNAVWDPETGKPQAASFQYARTEWKILDESIRKDWEYLSGVTDGDFYITSRTRDDNLWTVSYVVDDGPVRYYLYDRSEGKAEFLFTNRSELEGLPLASMKPVIIKSRDGLDLVSYLTLPVGAEQDDEQLNLPMVLLVHGGPWARDGYGFNSLHQWLANRGYAALSVNFRGSTGFGKDFVNAGNREWAGKMHDDLIDAVNWAVEQGIADKDRVAIMGGSYGGYATLVGLTFTPEVFAAGVDIVGPSHVRTLLETIPPYWEPVKVMFETRVGALDEEEFLDSISPLTKVEEIRRPLLIGQGANDPRVKESESQQIVDAMQARDIPVTYVLFPDEGHGFARPENTIAFWAVTEAFLAEHLNGRFEEITSELRESSAEIPAGATNVPGLEQAM